MAALARLWSLREEHPTFVAGALVALAFFLAYPLVDWQLRAAGVAAEFGFWDFGAYNAAVERWLADEALYVADENGSYHGSYLYPPVFLLAFRPFVTLPFRQAALAWELFSVGLLWVGLQLVVGACGYRLRLWERGGLLWLLAGFQPLLLSAKLGQVSAALTAVLCFALAGMLYGERGREHDRDRGLVRGASGALTALVAVKLPYAPAGAHLLQDRDRLLGAVAAGAAVVAASLLVFGVDAHWTFLEVLRWGMEGGTSSRPPQLWLAPYYRPFYLVSDVSLGLRVGGALAISTLALLAASADVDRETFALGAAAIPLLAPRTYTYYFVAALPAVVLLLAVELEREDGRPLVPVVAVLLLNVHSFGLKLLVDHLPAWFSLAEAIQPAAPALQPGLWGNLLLVGLAAARVAEAGSLPPWLDERV